MEERIDRSSTPAVAVRRAIAGLERCRPEQLGDLESVVDVDELNELVDAPTGDGPDDVESIVFPYCGYLVSVGSDRTLLIEP